MLMSGYTDLMSSATCFSCFPEAGENTPTITIFFIPKVFWAQQTKNVNVTECLSQHFSTDSMQTLKFNSFIFQCCQSLPQVLEVHLNRVQRSIKFLYYGWRILIHFVDFSFHGSLVLCVIIIDNIRKTKSSELFANNVEKGNFSSR